MTKAAKPAAKKAAPAAKKAAPRATNGEGRAAKVQAAAPAEDIQIQAPQPQPGAQPAMRILGQYLKDLSFENPNAP